MNCADLVRQVMKVNKRRYMTTGMIFCSASKVQPTLTRKQVRDAVSQLAMVGELEKRHSVSYLGPKTLGYRYDSSIDWLKVAVRLPWGVPRESGQKRRLP